jgi:hypothetical protein
MRPGQESALDGSQGPGCNPVIAVDPGVSLNRAKLGLAAGLHNVEEGMVTRA